MDLHLIEAYFIEHQRLMNHVSDNTSTEAPITNDQTKDSNLIELDDYVVLPTFHRLLSLRKLLDACVSDVFETFCGGDKREVPNSVRPLLNYLELLLALSSLHNFNDFVEKILTVIRIVGLQSKRLHDERYSYACSILNFIEAGQYEAAQELFNSKPSCLTVLPSCPEHKAFVIELAAIMINNFHLKDESLCNKLQVLSTSYEHFFKTMTPESVISHSICLLWRLKIRLQVGDATLFEQDSVFHLAERVREISYSLAYFCFGDMSSACKAQDTMFKSKVNNLLYGWSALYYLIESTYFMAHMFAVIGANRESVCMLNSLKKLSRKFCLPDRMIQCLRLALHFDEASGKQSPIQIHSKQMDYIRNSTDPFPIKPVDNTEKSQESEDEEEFLHSKLSQLNSFSPNKLASKASHFTEFTGSSPISNRKKLASSASQNIDRYNVYDSIEADWFTVSRCTIEEHVINTTYRFTFFDDSRDRSHLTPATPSLTGSSDNSSNNLINLLNNFKTPESVVTRVNRSESSSSSHNTTVPPPPLRAPSKKNFPESTPLVSSVNAPKRRGRPVKQKKAFSSLDTVMQNLTVGCGGGKMSLLALGQVIQGENFDNKATHPRVDKKTRPPGKGILLEKNSLESKKSHQDEELDPIEMNTAAPFIPTNIRLKTKFNTASDPEQLKTPAADKVSDRIVNEITKDVGDSLIEAYRQLRWLPSPPLFRPLCHLLALQALQQDDQLKAAFYLTKSVFISFRMNYKHELIKKLKHKSLANETLRTALDTFQSCHSDLPSWNEIVKCTLPTNWLLIQFTLVNELNLVAGENSQHHRRAPFLLATKIRATEIPQTRLVQGFSMKGIDDFENLLVENLQSTSITKANKYWNKRYNLDNDMEKLMQQIKEQWFSKDDLDWLLGDQSENEPIVLILDRCLSNFPFEWLLNNSSECHMTRMPCLSIALSHFYITSLLPSGKKNDQSTSPDAPDSASTNRKLVLQDGFYVLNPERNLPNTEERLVPLLSDPSLSWDGVVGRAPTKNEAIKALEDHEILMYCGHGSGSRYLFPKNLCVTKSKAVALLFGCSSSRLHQEGVFEPTSSMLTHLIAGSPCILGLLWDVTDADIDRYSCRLLQTWQNSNGSSKFLHLVRESRMACKLKHLIGKSPVVYGYPIEKL